MTFVDKYQQQNDSVIAYGSSWEAPTLSDTENLTRSYKYVVAIAAGDVKCVSVNGTTDTFTLALNEILPVRPVQIYSTGTTATLRGVF